MKKFLFTLLPVFLSLTAFAQVIKQQQIIDLGKAYRNFMFRNEPTGEVLQDLKAGEGSLPAATDFIIQTITTNNKLLTKRYLTLPDEATLKAIYLIHAINSNLAADEPLDNSRVVDSFSKMATPRAELIDNYYSLLFTAVGNKNKPGGISSIDFRLRDYNLANETEKSIFFLRCMNACGTTVWGYINIAKPMNTAKAYALIKKFPTFSGQPYYQYNDFSFPDFTMLISKDEGPQSYKSYYLNKYYELLLNHLLCLNKEGASEKETHNLLLGSILKDERYYKYTTYKPELQSIFREVALKFDKHFIDCEDKWIAFRPDSTGRYSFGFIYFDEEAGLTHQAGGYFRLSKSGEFIRVPSPLDTISVKARLEPGAGALVAIIPDAKLKELGLKAVPDWLKAYKTDTGTAQRLYRWGYLYNVYDRPDLALPYLERAYRKEPAHKGLAPELAYTYNSLNQYDKTLSVLDASAEAKTSPCYYYKEYSYAQLGLEKLDAAAATVQQALGTCRETAMKTEMAYNVAVHYYQAGKLTNAKTWLEEAKKWSKDGDVFGKRISDLEGAMGK